MSASYAQTLILNQTYRPHEIIDWKEAVTRMFNGKIEILAQYDEILAVIGRQHLAVFPDLRKALRQVIGTDTESITIKVPAVAVLRKKVSREKSGIKFSKINVCLRDDFTCMYCGDKLPMSKLNFDHVIPKSRWRKEGHVGSPTVWTNIVAACYACNSHKEDRTPQEAGMTLLRVPVVPKVLPMNEPYIDPAKAPAEWTPYLRAV
jgi:5-methylcytosine-specific restriction endonuclease McrA